MQKDEIYEDKIYLCFKPNFIWSDKMIILRKYGYVDIFFFFKQKTAYELETLSFVISITPVSH